MARTPLSQTEAGLKHGFRSGLEEAVAAELHACGVLPVLFEEYTLTYAVPARPARYTPDFVLPNGIIIETKGRFLTADRQKHILVKGQHPDLDIRFVFSNPNTRLTKTSRTTYGMWCDKQGFKFAKKSIPKAWLDEPVSEARWEAIRRICVQKKAP